MTLELKVWAIYLKLVLCISLFCNKQITEGKTTAKLKQMTLPLR